MSFGEIVGEVVLTGFPDQLEMMLVNSVLDPMVPHVDGLAAFDFGCAVGDSSSGYIVVDDLCRFLGVAEVT